MKTLVAPLVSKIPCFTQDLVWVVSMSRADFTKVTEYSHLYSKHFKKENYNNLLEYDLKRESNMSCRYDPLYAKNLSWELHSLIK